MKKEIDKEEIKKCLKDANIYEENMPDDLMVEYYKAIKNSESSHKEECLKEADLIEEAEKSLNESANELLEAINNSESIAPSKKSNYLNKSDDDDDSLDAFSQDIFQKSDSKSLDKETNNNNNSILMDNKQEKANDIILAIKNTPIGFNDMPKSQTTDKDVLRIISRELKFINIQNSKKFLVANSKTRIKMLCNYHLAAAKLRARCAKLSPIMAPVGKPITATDHDLSVNPVISSLKEEEIHLSSETTYISRSGRLTKRKVYNEFDDTSLDSFSSNLKRTKNDEEWKSSSKTPKSSSKKSESEESNPNNNSIMEKSLSKPHTKVKRSESPDSSQDVTLVSGFLEDEFDKLKEDGTAQQKPRTYQRKGLPNDEIMTRSSLFRDTSTPKKGRSASLVNAGKIEAEKRTKREEEIARFASTLNSDSQILDDESEKIIVDDDDDEVLQRRRVVPPLPSPRKPIHGRKRGGAVGPEALNISAKRPNLSSAEEPNEPAVNGVNRKASLPRRVNNNNSEPSSSSSSKAKKDSNMMPCPLCSLSFPQKEIEEHAATCGEDLFPQTDQPKRITCEVCDAIVPFTTDYEVHVKTCIAKKNSGGLV